MTNYELIKAACQKANPDLMKLSFGCDIKTMKWSSNNPVETITQTHHGEFIEYECSGRSGRVRAIDIVEILGHEPQLSDVLLLLSKITSWRINQKSDDKSIWMDAYRQDTSLKPISGTWDLFKPLKLQSEETLSFMASLL